MRMVPAIREPSSSPQSALDERSISRSANTGSAVRICAIIALGDDSCHVQIFEVPQSKTRERAT